MGSLSSAGLFRLGAAVLGMAGVGALVQAWATRRDERRYPPPGALVDVGGNRLHLDVRGDGPGPTVVLEAGMGSFSPNWYWVQSELAPALRVVAYDRAGLGWSERGTAPRDADTLAVELHTALQAAGVPGPYVLAGHSFGGLYVRIFAAQYPDEVAGMVLIDSTGAHLPASTSAQSWGPDDILARGSVLASTSARLGVGRLFGLAGYGSLPPQSADEVRAKIATSTSLRSTIDEFLQATASEHEAAALTDFGDKPLVVLTAGSGNDAAWMKAQDQTATLSTNSVHRVAQGATHPDLILKQQDAALTAQAIIDVVSSVRSNQPLK